MAAFHGFAGSITFTGITPTNVISWTADITVDMAEITDMGDTWKTFLAGFKDWTASATCLLDTTGPDIAALGTAQTLTLTAVSGTTLSGNAFCTGIAVSTDANGIPTVTYTFQGSGAVS